MLERELSLLPRQFQTASIDAMALAEAKKRVLDSLGCFYGAFNANPGRTLRATFLPRVSGETTVWGTGALAPAELAAWTNGTCVRTLDYNDTYLSLEPCHPSDLIAPLWAACELSGSKDQGRLLLRAMVLGYDVMCRLCDANSIRVRGWDHVTYLPIASAVACSYIFKLDPERARHAVALALVGNNAMRQTRVGMISDWKAACAAYAARSGLWAARLAANGFSGPSDIFSGKNGFFNQVSGPFSLPKRSWKAPWKIMDTHTKFFPAEHHAQSAIEAAISLSTKWGGLGGVSSIEIETFDVAVDIIGSEKEKWLPTTRETADHSMPYLVSMALLEGDVTLQQYERKRFLEPRVRALMKKVRMKRSRRYSRMYPKKMPTRVTVLAGGKRFSEEVLLPKGYAGRPMTVDDVERKFHRLASPLMAEGRRAALVRRVASLESVPQLKSLARLLTVRK